MKPLIKHYILACICTFALSFTAFAQQKYHYKGQATEYMEEARIDTLHATAQQLYRVHLLQKAEVLLNDHYYYDYPFRNIGVRFNEGKKSNSQIYEGMDWGRNNDFKTILIDGDCPVEFSALYITEKNAKDFRYHVVEDDNKELVTWSIPALFKYSADQEVKYAYLGKFNYRPGHVLKIEIYNVKQYSQQDGMIIDRRKVVKADLSGTIDYISHQFHSPDNGLISSSLNYVPKMYKLKRPFGKVIEFRDEGPFIKNNLFR